ncbi:transglutaminase domain-containing protein [Flavipsychrobacter stenotrophus]|nr:transglutaminase domain-containing protein [Flavipsychrobacter stenotrophus]
MLHTSFAQPVLPDRAADSIALAIPAASTKTITGIAKYINVHFATDEEKVRAAFIWVASTFSYDVPNMVKQDIKQTPQSKISKALATHSSVCEHYALVFNEVCNTMGITSYVVTGCTRKNGSASVLPHAWCCAKVDGKWQLYDPTWASGYVQDGKFVRKINDAFYKVDPYKMIATHMPFDPMWELLKYPITNQDLLDSMVTEGTYKVIFNFEDSIATWQHQTEEQRLLALACRMESSGLTSSMITDEYNRTKMNLAYINSQKYNASVNEFNKAVQFLNTFITYRNHQFIPAKPDNAILAMLDSTEKQLTLALAKIADVRMEGNIDAKVLGDYEKLRTDFIAKLDAQKSFLTHYMARDIANRKLMFEE